MPKDDLSYQSLIETVPSMTEAIERCVYLGGMKPKEAAYKLGIGYDAYQRMMNPDDNRHFPPDLIERQMRNAGNLFPLDWLERRMGRCVYPLDMMAILEEIRKALRDDGRSVNFALRALLERQG